MTLRGRIGLYGGSFDPVHNGHLAAAKVAQELARLDEVWFLPASLSPFKLESEMTSNEHRLSMLRLAVEKEERFRVSTADLERGGVSYAIDSLRSFREEYPDADFFFIIGADSLAGLRYWRQSADFLKMCEFVVLARPGWDIDQSLLSFTPDERHKLSRWVARDFEHPVSSSEVRRRLSAGERVEDLVPRRVAEYISELGLYAAPDLDEQKSCPSN